MADVKLTSFANSTGRLARLLAKENLQVVHGDYSTASMDVENRVLRLPTFKGNISQSVYTMLVAHEVGHALYTPVDGWHDSDKDIPGVSRDLVNVVEDIRIEKLIRRQYEGLYRDFDVAYIQLVNQDFFGTDHTPVHRMGFLSRLNIYSKARHVLHVPFTADEQDLVDKAMLVETWNDVLHVCRKIKAFCENRSHDRYSIMEFLEQLDEKSELRFDIEDEDEDEDLEPDAPRGSLHVDRDEDVEEKKASPKGAGASMDAPMNDDEESSSEDKEDDTDTSGVYGKTKEVSQEFTEKDDEELEGDLEARSDRTYRDREAELSYGAAGSTIRIKHDIVDSKLRLAPRSHTAKIEHYDAWIQANKNFVNKMLNEFNMRKSARREARTSQARSGSLDPVKLANYMFEEDLFLRYGVNPKESNHGVLIAIDSSYSMRGAKYKGMISQMMLMAEFSRKAGIPFKVISWTNPSHGAKKFAKKYPYAVVEIDNYQGTVLIDSTMKAADYKRQMAYCYEIVYLYRSPEMGGTPTGENIVAMTSLAARFKEAHGIDKLHAVLMADDAHINGIKLSHINRFSGVTYGTQYRVELGERVWNIECPAGEKILNTEAVLRVLRDICESVTYYAVGSKGNLGSFCDASRVDDNMVARLRSQLASSQYGVIKGNAGMFDNMVYLSERGVSGLFNIPATKYDENGEIIMADMKSFKKDAKVKSGVKRLCTEFIKFIA